MAGKKSKMIPALHVDEDLHGAIKQAADRGGRRMIDHVRYVLEIWHGLRQPENLPQHLGQLIEGTQPPGQKKSHRALGHTG